METHQLEIHFVTHNAFSRYDWSLTDMEKEYYQNFKRGSYCVIPNDSPYAIAAIVSDSSQKLESDILPAIRWIKKFLKDSNLGKDDLTTNKVIKVKFVGFNPTNNIRQATTMMMQNIIGLGFTYTLA